MNRRRWQKPRGPEVDFAIRGGPRTGRTSALRVHPPDWGAGQMLASLSSGAALLAWCCWMRRSRTAWPARLSALISWGLLYCSACLHWGWLAPTVSTPRCKLSGRQWGARRSPAMLGQSCQSAARLPSRRQSWRRPSRQSLSADAAGGGAGCSSSRPLSLRRCPSGAIAITGD